MKTIITSLNNSLTVQSAQQMQKAILWLLEGLRVYEEKVLKKTDQ